MTRSLKDIRLSFLSFLLEVLPDDKWNRSVSDLPFQTRRRVHVATLTLTYTTGPQ
jgi:hypothetical protein